MFMVKPKFPALNRSRSISKNIVGAWPIYEPLTTNIHDVSGNNHNSTAIIGDPAMVHSSYGRAFEADGTGDGINFGNDSDFTVGDGSTDYMYTWFINFKLTSLSALGVLLSKDDVVSPISREWLIYFNSTGDIICLIFEDGSTSTRIGRGTPTGLLTTGVETQLMVTYDASAASSGIKIYANRVRADTYDSPSGSYTVNGDDGVPFKAGLNHVTSNGIAGQISNIVLWKNRALTLQDYQKLTVDPFLMYRPSLGIGWMTHVPGAPSSGLLMSPGMDGMGSYQFDSAMNGGMNG